MGDQIDSILYLPTGSERQQEECRLLGLSFIRSNYIKSKDSVRNKDWNITGSFGNSQNKRRWKLFFSKPITSSNRFARLP